MKNKSKSLLINYVSTPEILASLMPDIGLAVLAGALKKEGHKTKILDYATLDTIKRFCPSLPVQQEFNQILGDLENYFQESNFASEEMLNKFDLSRYQDALAKEAGEKRKEIDFIINEIDQEIRRMHPDFIGFKLWAGESYTEIVAIAEELKKRHPRVIFLGGGPQVDWSMGSIYHKTKVFDILAYGEGDEVIVEVADYSIGSKKLENISNIIYFRDGKINLNPGRMIEDLNDLAFPDYTLETYPALEGNNKLKVFLLEESRGCPNRCNFCIHPIKSGTKWRTKKPERIIAEIKDIIDTHQSRYFRFSGSNTPLFLQTTIAEEIIRQNIKIKYSSFGHIGSYKNCDYGLMKKAGCESLLFGLESGSHEIQKNVINKVIKLEDAKRVIDECKSHGIKTVMSVIYPNPKETEESRKETLHYLDKLKPDSVFICMPFIVPRTKWFLNPEAYDIEIPSKERHIDFMMTYHVRFNGHPILWNFGKHKVNGLDFRQQGLECGKFVDEIRKIGIVTQITEEEMLFSDIIGTNYVEFAKTYQRLRTNCDMDNLGKMLVELNAGANAVH